MVDTFYLVTVTMENPTDTTNSSSPTDEAQQLLWMTRISGPQGIRKVLGRHYETKSVESILLYLQLLLLIPQESGKDLKKKRR